jgi:hypothetical protein
MSYYVLNGEKTEGPYSLQQLRELWASGIVTGQTLYCQEGFDQWIPLETLAQDLRQLPPVPKPPISSALPASASIPKQSRGVGVWVGHFAAVLIVGYFIGAYIAGRTESDYPWVAYPLGVILSGIYFLPTLLAEKNRNRNSTSIMLINFFLGWTLLGWLGALVWAIYRERDTAR